MNAGSGPERDDFGLPPVEIEIPDDARELDADVQAYHRELRALRRKQRSDRLRRPLSRRGRRPGREGITLPVLACCLMLALITSTLLVMFAADETGVPPSPGTRSAATARATGRAGQPLPHAQIILRGAAVPLQTITAGGPSVLALVPADCSCVPAMRQLAAAAGPAHVRLYLVGQAGEMNQVTRLAALAGQATGQVVNDMNNILATVYAQHGLTALLVRAGGTVSYIARDLSPHQDLGPLRAQLQQLGAVSAGR